MKKSIARRVEKLEKLFHTNQVRRKVAIVIYDPNICLEDDLPKIEADVILCLPDNGHRIPKEKTIPSKGYLIKYS